MMKAVFLSILFFSSLFFQGDEMQRHVVRTHPNGQDYVVMYTVGLENERVKEELFFENGQLDYVGHYKNGQEHGEWIYYWPNGNLKSYELYKRGKEDGIHYDCDENGARIKEYHYMNGTLVKEVDL